MYLDYGASCGKLPGGVVDSVGGPSRVRLFQAEAQERADNGGDGGKGGLTPSRSMTLATETLEPEKGWGGREAGKQDRIIYTGFPKSRIKRGTRTEETRRSHLKPRRLEPDREVSRLGSEGQRQG